MKKFIFPLFFSLISAKAIGQDAFFTSTNQSLLYQNPSFAGTNGFIRNQTLYRNQWPNLSYPNFVTFLNSFDAYVNPMKAGMGLTAVVDDYAAGTLKTTWLSYVYAQHISFKGSGLKLIPSLQITYFQETLDKSKLNFGDAMNPRYNIYWTFSNSIWGPSLPSSSKKNIGFSSGLLALYKNFTLGISAFNFNQPDIGLYGVSQLPARYCFYLSWYKEIGTDLTLQVCASYNNQKSWNRWQISPSLFYKKIFLNIGFSDAYGPGFNEATYGRLSFMGMGMRLKKMTVFYQYGLSFSKLSGSTAVSNELFSKLPVEKKRYPGKQTA
jgi:type IX secretion system PorP/SprF family membrane protein